MTKKQDKDLFSLLRQVNAALGRGPRQGLSVKPGQNKILKMLSEREGSMAQTELLQELGIRPPSLYELLQKLENEELIVRHRAKQFNALVVNITEKGRIAALENELSNSERDLTFFGSLNKEDKSDLTRILNTLLASWGDAPAETEGQRRERRWKENEELQSKQREAKRRPQKRKA